MHILFFFPREYPYDSDSVRRYPSGGTEKAVIFLGEGLQRLGHTVTWVTQPVELEEAVKLKPDVVITQVAQYLDHWPGAYKVWWCHHFSDQPVIQEHAWAGRVFADVTVTLSKCQNQDFKDNLRIDSQIIPHGVWLDEVKHPDKLRNSFIYASTPFRGLERIPDLWPIIRDRWPDATLTICSSMATYRKGEEDEAYQLLFDALTALPGVNLTGSLNQDQLYTEYAKAEYLLYPSIWRETYCIALDEAIAHGCKPLISDLGALPERVEPVINFENTECYGLKTVKRAVLNWTAIAFQWERLFRRIKMNSIPAPASLHVDEIIQSCVTHPKPNDPLLT